jgi:hypothetical protein
MYEAQRLGGFPVVICGALGGVPERFGGSDATGL